MTQAITGAQLFTGEHFLDDHALIIDGERIQAVVPSDQIPSSADRLALQGGILAPGFIDTQVNGGGDILFNKQPDIAGLRAMVKGHRAFGTTGMMPTLISDEQTVLERGINAAKAALEQGEPGILGLHIEGPFFNPLRRGTHKESCIRDPQGQDIEWLCQIPPLPCIVTLAPEKTVPGQIRALSEAGLIVCAGHTDAHSTDISAAINEGLRGFTHLFNAMRPLQGREPGVVGAALDDANSWCGIIADGHHVDPMSIRVAVAAKATGKVILVTDAMATVGGELDHFQIYDETIYARDGKLVNAEGALAGSAIGMIDALRICHKTVGIDLAECLRMASLYPAEFLNIATEKGRLHAGYSADLVHFSADCQNVHSTWIGGQAMSHG